MKKSTKIAIITAVAVGAAAGAIVGTIHLANEQEEVEREIEDIERNEDYSRKPIYVETTCAYGVVMDEPFDVVDSTGNIETTESIEPTES